MAAVVASEKKEVKLIRGLDDEGLDGPAPLMGLNGPFASDLSDPWEDRKINPCEQLTVASALGALAGRDLFSDVTFLVGSGADKREIPAHRVILAAGSEIFEAMLYPPRFPGDDDKQGDVQLPKVITIPDIQPLVFRKMLQCIYSDTADIRAEELPDLISCANKFQLESLRLLCLTFMEEGVTADNACKLFETADKLLQEKSLALTFIEENAEEVAKTPGTTIRCTISACAVNGLMIGDACNIGWDTLPRDRLQAILDSSKLSIDEVDLFRAVSRWGSCELKRSNLLDTSDNKRIILTDVITKIRFPTMTMEEIATHVSPSGLLTSSQLLEIFSYVGTSDKSKAKKTSWNTTPRTGSKEKCASRIPLPHYGTDDVNDNDIIGMLDTSLKSSTIILSQANLTFNNTGSAYGYCVGSTSWSRGKHAWRVVRDTNPTAWLFLGVSRKVSHQNASFNDASTWGLSSASQRYFQGSATSMTANFNTGPLDVLYDADAGTLAILNLSNGTRHDIPGLPTGQELVPHFTPNGAQQISVYPIHTRDFGNKTLVLRRGK